MRRIVICGILPLVFCCVPGVAGGVIAVALPERAQKFYLNNISQMDRLILGLGVCLLAAQLLVSWRALQWRGHSFDEAADPWLNQLAQAAEWFPLLGLLGTVAGILQ